MADFPEDFEQIIEKTKRERFIELDLSYNYYAPNLSWLTEIPPCVLKMNWLQVLNLKRNQITELPEAIGNLINLTKLYLKENQLTKLPETIGNLTNLTELYLEENQLTKLPETIGNLTNLIGLSLWFNKLTELPESIGNLTNLTELNLGDNQLEKLPNTVWNLTNLTDLYLCKNKLTKLPEAIGNLINLTHLYLGHNQLTELPDNVWNLINLIELYLQGNQFTMLPCSIKNLKKLKKLYISSNQQLDLSVLSNLKELELWLNNVKLPRKYWLPIRDWRSQWILEEQNAEVRRLLIQVIGYEKICLELEAQQLDLWREYILVKIDIPQVREEDIHLLTMKCPSTGYIHALRIPPNIKSAKDAITWVNWEINPEEFDVET